MSIPSHTPRTATITLAVSEAIREAGEIPSGTLYAMLMGKVDYEGYQAILRTLTNAGLIQTMPSHVVRWTGPKIEKGGLNEHV